MRGTIPSKASLGLFSRAVLSLLETTGKNFPGASLYMTAHLGKQLPNDVSANQLTFTFILIPAGNVIW